MSPTVKIRPGASDEETIPATTKWTRRREVGKMRRARITVPRADAEAVTLNEKEDDIELVGVDTLRLVDVETGGPEWTLVCYSYEWLANTVKPTTGGNLRTGSDADLVNGWIADVPQWTAGTVNQQATGLSFIFNHAAPHEGLRRVEKNVPGELKFRDTGTVDYTARLGSDKTGSVTLSSANQNIEDEINITKRGRELDGTHIRVLGAHEGEAQFFANLVPSDDSATYENRVNYSTSRWSDGDARDFDRYVNKDVTDQITIEEEAAELGTEITERLVEAKATTNLTDLDVGDSVQVVKSDADLDRAMRIHRIKEIAKGGIRKAKLLLSTRTIVRSDDSKDLRDIQRFNSGYQGSSVVVQGGGSRQPVDASNNAEIPFFYPSLEFENKAELFVRGLHYRHYSVPNTHDHSVSVFHPSHEHDIATTSTDNAEFAQSYSDNPSISNQTINDSSWTEVSTTATVNGDTSFFYSQSSIKNKSSNSESIRMRLRNKTTGFIDSTSPGSLFNIPPDGHAGYIGMEPTNVNGEDLVVEAKARIGSFETTTSTFFRGIGQHTHDVSTTSTTELGTTTTTTSDTAPGVTAGINETADTPSGVDVKVDGTTVATDIGTGTFRTTVDISDELTKDAWNLIELTSDNLGHIQGTISIRGYNQIGKS
jgi:hypothetical protein